MIVIDYQKKFHTAIIKSCVMALKQRKVLAYPTDTSYGLAVDATNVKAIKKLYQIKGRHFNKPVHIVVPSVTYAKKISVWNKSAVKLAGKFWPGALTFVLPLRISAKGGSASGGKDNGLRILSAATQSIGLRMPDNKIALDLAKNLRRPITATSANLSGELDAYSANDIIRQFKGQTHKPDIIINAGKLPVSKPSTLVRTFDDVVKVLREGPVTQKQIISLLNTKEY